MEKNVWLKIDAIVAIETNWSIDEPAYQPITDSSTTVNFLTASITDSPDGWQPIGDLLASKFFCFTKLNTIEPYIVLTFNGANILSLRQRISIKRASDSS